MAKREFQTVKAWVDQRDGAIYSRGVYGGGVTHNFSGNLPGKAGTGTLPRLEQIAEELQRQGYKEIARTNGLHGELTVTYERATPENPWEEFDMTRAQNTPSDATERPTTGDTGDPEDDTAEAQQRKVAGDLRHFNTTIKF